MNAGAEHLPPRATNPERSHYEHALTLRARWQALSIYRHYRLTAAALLHPTRVTPPKTSAGGGGGGVGVRLGGLLSTKHVTLLGRPVEFAAHLSTRLATLQYQSLNYALVRFKATGLSGVRELDALLEATRCTARLLCAQVTLNSIQP
jgi:hypothetical protein